MNKATRRQRICELETRQAKDARELGRLRREEEGPRYKHQSGDAWTLAELAVARRMLKKWFQFATVPDLIQLKFMRHRLIRHRTTNAVETLIFKLRKAWKKSKGKDTYHGVPVDVKQVKMPEFQQREVLRLRAAGKSYAAIAKFVPYRREDVMRVCESLTPEQKIKLVGDTLFNVRATQPGRAGRKVKKG